ncbi:MAG: HAMP domain-containing sensor histidine kinase [Acidimicrobiia bacterium]|nr:HAMP domain-containing sensor histidine kinase [Acidimicrobiia bacterium]
MAPNTGRPRRARIDSRRQGRFAVLSLGVGVALILVFALVFSVAFGSKGIAEHADALHNADEALRSATVARSQAGLAAHLTVLEEDFGFDAADGIELATGEARIALSDLRGSLEALERSVAPLPPGTGADFLVAAEAVLDALDTGDEETASRIAATDLDAGFRDIVGVIVAIRNEEATAVAAANDLMGRIGDAARFLVAFLVPTAAIVVYRELSKRQQRQKELEFRLETEQEIGKARDEFVANASHELRTPLTSIFGLAHVLEEDEHVAESETALEMVNLIISETHDLSRMVDDLLTTARLDADALHFQFEDVDVLEEVQEVVEPMRRSGIEVAVDVRPSLVRSDRLRLRQVLRNLVSNAAKYGGDRIRIRGGVESGWYELRVEDDGEGIPPELEGRLFQRYLHEGDVPLVLGSVGLGLSIVRALSEGMGGAVWHEREDGWTCFVVRVPLAATGPGDQPRFAEPALYRRRRELTGAGADGPADAAVDVRIEPAVTDPTPETAERPRSETPDILS